MNVFLSLHVDGSLKYNYYGSRLHRHTVAVNKRRCETTIFERKGKP